MKIDIHAFTTYFCISLNVVLTPLVLMHRIRLYDLAILNFSVFHEVSLKLRKFCELYVNFGEKR